MSTLEPALAVGLCTADGPGGLRAATAQGDLPCRRAASCLVQPRPGDQLLLALDGQGRAWVLAVLECAPARPGLELVLDGPAELQVRGSLTLRCEADLALAAGRRLTAAAEQLAVAAQQGSVRVDRLAVLGRFLDAQCKRLHLLAVKAEQVFQRVTCRSQQSFRSVAGHDDVQAGSRRVLVQQDLATQAGSAVLLAEDHVTVNAAQINLG